MISTLIAIVFFFLLSIFFSMAEMAFISCNKLRLKHLAGEKNLGAMIIREFQQNTRMFLAAVLFGNNLVNISIAALSAYFFETHLGIRNEFLVTLILSPLVIVFAETVPKDYGRQKANEVIYQIAVPLRLIYRIFEPFSRVMLILSEGLLKMFGSHEKKSPFVTKEELHHLINESARQGIIKEHEKRLVDTILNFERMRVEEVMTPLERVAQIELTEKIGDLKDKARKGKASYFLVYEEIPSIIIGAIYVFDVLFEKNEQQPLTPFLRPPLFLPRSLSAEKAFLKLQEKHQSFAVVLDENSEAVGVVSIDNLLAL